MGTPVEVLGRASLAEIHVPYDDNGARFHDLSDFGLGNDSMDDARRRRLPQRDAARRPGRQPGHRLPDRGRPTGYAYKDYNQVGQSTSLNLFSASCIGAYCYVVAWNFDDDGTIRPEVGATGSLQTLRRPRRSRLADGPVAAATSPSPTCTTSTGGSTSTWTARRTTTGSRSSRPCPPPGAPRQELNNRRRAFTSEVARRVAPGGFRSWRVRDLNTRNADNHPISWELLPNTDHIFRGPSYEPWTQHELYVTRNKTCERFATHNPATGAVDAPNDLVAASPTARA